MDTTAETSTSRSSVVTAKTGDIRPVPGKGDSIADAALAIRLIPRRSFGAHKWGVGGLLIVGGAPGYIGAPILAAMAAQRAGAGILNLAVPRGVASVIASAVPEAAFLTLSETETAHGARRSAEEISGRLEKAAAIVIGPGLGEDESSDGLMAALFGASSANSSIGFGVAAAATAGTERRGLLTVSDRPILIDADGLNWLARQDEWWTLLPAGRCVLTPHLGEMSRLTGRTADELSADPLGAAKTAAAKWGQTVVLKYGFTVATDGDRAIIADDAPRSLASAGTGDVLAGTIGAFLAQGLAPLDAAALAIYVGCAAARRVEATMGTLGLIASDLPPAIAAELAVLERSSESTDGR